MKTKRFAYALPYLFLAGAPIASAHPGHSANDGFAAGLAHPFSGWDHVLAMLAVGLWAAQLGGRARWLIPSACITMMAVGASFGHLCGTAPGIEQGIIASVLILGLLVAAAVRLPSVVSVTLVGVFTMFHGLAHGSEMPATAGGLAYGAGFIAATSLLLAAGMGSGVLGTRCSVNVPRLAGLTIVACGILLFAF